MDNNKMQTRSDFVMNLQLFADEPTPAPAQETPPQSTESEQLQTSSTTPTPQIGLNEDGTVDFLDDETPISGNDDGDDIGSTDNAETEIQKPDLYTPDEVRSMDFEKLDPNRIPEEMKPWYRSMQAGFTKKTQAAAERIREAEERERIAQEKQAEFEQLIRDLKGVQQPQAQEPTNTVDPEVDFFNKITEAAKQRVAEKFGSEFDEFNTTHQTALQFKVQEVMREVQQQYEQEEQRQKELQAVQVKEQSVNELVAKYQAEIEPVNWDAINFYAKEKLEKMASKESSLQEKAMAKYIVDGIRSYDTEVIQTFIDECRKEWYGMKEGIKPVKPQTKQQTATPNFVESAGSQTANTQQKRADLSKLAGSTSIEDKAKWLIENGIV